jgi:hypothetical protein
MQRSCQRYFAYRIDVIGLERPPELKPNNSDPAGTASSRFSPTLYAPHPSTYFLSTGEQNSNDAGHNSQMSLADTPLAHSDTRYALPGSTDPPSLRPSPAPHLALPKTIASELTQDAFLMRFATSKNMFCSRKPFEPGLD